jgi:hypothetical protein
MAGITMSSYRTHIPSFYLDTGKFFACFKISYFKAKKAVNSRINKGLVTINSKGANEVSEGANLINKRVGFCV